MKSGKPSAPRGFYRQIYGISPWSIRYWWMRFRANRRLFRGLVATLFLLVGFAVLALTLFRPRLSEGYHGLRAERYDARARAFLDADDAASAKIELQNSLRHRPDSPGTLGLYAQVLDRLGEEGAFFPAMEAWLADSTNEALGIQALRLCLQGGQGEAAGVIAARLVKQFPASFEVRLLMASFWTMRGRPDFAYQAACKARDLNPADPRADFATANLGALQTDPKIRDASIARLDAFRSDAKHFLPATRALVSALAGRQPATALTLQDELIAKEPNPWAARLQRAAIAHRLHPEQTPAAIDALLATAATATQTNAAASLSLRLLTTAQTQEILDRLPAAHRARPPLLLTQLRLWDNAGAWDRIIEASSAAIPTDLKPQQKLDLWIWQARAHRERRDQPALLASLRVARNLARAEPIRQLQAAQLFLAFGFHDESRACFQELADVPGQMGAFARERLLTLSWMNKDAEAMLATAEKALTANPRNPVAMNNVAACLLLLDRDPARALDLAAAAHATRTNFAHFADTHATALAANGRVIEAIAIYERTDLARIRDPAVWLNYADALFRAGRVPEARAMLTNVNEKTLLPQQMGRYRAIIGNQAGEIPPTTNTRE